MIYFFCHDKDERLNTANAILANLLAQLLKYIPDVGHFSVELEYAINKEKSSWEFGMLWRVFERIINDTNTGHMRVLIDALSINSYLDYGVYS